LTIGLVQGTSTEQVRHGHTWVLQQALQDTVINILKRQVEGSVGGVIDYVGVNLGELFNY